jgi:hypothetical protein
MSLAIRMSEGSRMGGWKADAVAVEVAKQPTSEIR